MFEAAALGRRINALEDALKKIKLRIIFMSWPAESFWNTGSEAKPWYIPDWRYECQLIEHMLHNTAVTTPEKPTDTIAWNQLPADQQYRGTVKIPPLNEDVEWILGRPNFACHDIANLHRRHGIDIKRKAEAEQAFVIHWLLGLYLVFGSEFRDAAARELDRMAEDIRQRELDHTNKD